MKKLVSVIAIMMFLSVVSACGEEGKGQEQEVYSTNFEEAMENFKYDIETYTDARDITGYVTLFLNVDDTSEATEIEAYTKRVVENLEDEEKPKEMAILLMVDGVKKQTIDIVFE